MTAPSTLKLPSFRDGRSFEARQPDADGFINIMDNVDGPKGQMMKIMVFEVLKRNFAEVTMDEVGRMEFVDFMAVFAVGSATMEAMGDMGFPSAESK